MREALGLRTEPIERVREGMTVLDAAGAKLGTVAYVKMGDPQTVTTQGNKPGEPGSLGAIPAPVTREPEPDVPEPLRSQLLRVGFIKVDGPGRVGRDRYFSGDRIGDVSGDTVRLQPPTSGTVRPEGALAETGGDLRSRSDLAGSAEASAEGTGAPAAFSQQQAQGPSRRLLLGAGGGALATIGGAVGAAWLYRRWRRDRDRLINRLRRQVRRAAAGRVWPAGGLGAVLVLAALLGRGLRAWVSPDGLLAWASDRLGTLGRAGQATTGEEARPHWGKIQLPTINTPSLRRVGRGPVLTAARARTHTASPPSGRTGPGLGGLLAFGAAGYLVRRALQGRESAPRADFRRGSAARIAARARGRRGRPPGRAAPEEVNRVGPDVPPAPA